MRPLEKILIALIAIATIIGINTLLLEFLWGQAERENRTGRNPFALPPGVHLLSKRPPNQEAALGTPEPERRPPEIQPDPLQLRAILLGDRIRLALIGREILTVGDTVGDEKIFGIGKDYVLLAKGEKKRILLLPQSPIRVVVEGKGSLAPNAPGQ